MKRQDIMALLKDHREEIHEMGVSSLRLFGSSARDEATETSDIDLLVEFSRPVGLFYFAGLRRRLSTILGHPVDLVTKNALREEMREEILMEAIDAA